MKEIEYQQKYVRLLVDMTIDLLRLSGHRKALIFKAPAGSGKSVMASQMLADLTEELQSRGDSPYQRGFPLICGSIPLHLLDILIEPCIVAFGGILQYEHRHAVHLLFRGREVSIPFGGIFHVRESYAQKCFRTQISKSRQERWTV